jgi:hypothetical protein
MSLGERGSALLSRALDLGEIDWAPRGRGIAVRAASVFGAAAILLWVCRSGQSQALLWVTFAAYAAAAAIWVRGQYAASLTPDGLWAPHPVLSGAVCAAFVGVFGIGLWRDSGTAFILGLVGAFFSLGYLSMGLRRRYGRLDGAARSDRAVRVWVGLLALGVLVALAGLALLGRVSWAWYVLGVGLALLPIPVEVLSDRFLRTLATRSRSTGGADHRLRWGVVVGCALVAVGWLVASLDLDRSFRSAVVLVGLGVLVAAVLILSLVSSTYADIAMIVAVIALLGVTQPQQSEDQVVPLGGANDAVLVALGDSYMSGEGAKTYWAGTDQGGDHENRCRRAPTAWAELAGQRYPFDGFYSLACSGARTYNVNLTTPPGAKAASSQFPATIGTQLADYQRAHEDLGFTPKLVVVSLGGNDAGFSTIGAMCLGPQDCDEEGDRLWMPRLDEVGAQLRATFAQVSHVFGGVPVAVVGYPDPIYRPTDPAEPRADCGRVPLSGRDRGFIERLLAGLNRTVEEAATDSGFYYVGQMAGSLAAAHLQLCDPRNDSAPGINVISLQSVSGVAEERFNPKNWYHNSLHPNERGHAAMLAAFETWLSKHDHLDADLPGRGSTPPPVATTAGAGGVIDCQLYDVDESEPTCEDVGYSWLGTQITDALLLDWWGLTFLLIGGGAWLLSVTFFAWRTRVVRGDLGTRPAAGVATAGSGRRARG